MMRLKFQQNGSDFLFIVPESFIHISTEKQYIMLILSSASTCDNTIEHSYMDNTHGILGPLPCIYVIYHLGVIIYSY